MPKIVGLILTAILLLPSPNPVRQEFANYKPIEAYEIRPGVLMMPRYSTNGEVCAIGLEKLHYSPEIVRLDPGLSRKEIDEIFDKLVPADERGPKPQDFPMDIGERDGVATTTFVEFQNVSLQIYGRVLSTQRNQEIAEDGVAAIIHWKNRKCQ